MTRLFTDVFPTMTQCNSILSGSPRIPGRGKFKRYQAGEILFILYQIIAQKMFRRKLENFPF